MVILKSHFPDPLGKLNEEMGVVSLNLGNEYSVSKAGYTPGLDINLALYFLSVGYQYNVNSQKFLLGVGLSGLLQFQWGKEIPTSGDVFCVRSDVPLLKWIVDNDIDYVNVGVAYEYISLKRDSEHLISLNLGVNFWQLFDGD